MTRCRCAECGTVLAWTATELELLVHPCGACLQEAAADAIAGCQELNEELECPLDTTMRELEQEGRG